MCCRSSSHETHLTGFRVELVAVPPRTGLVCRHHQVMYVTVLWLGYDNSLGLLPPESLSSLTSVTVTHSYRRLTLTGRSSAPQPLPKVCLGKVGFIINLGQQLGVGSRNSWRASCSSSFGVHAATDAFGVVGPPQTQIPSLS